MVAAPTSNAIPDLSVSEAVPEGAKDIRLKLEGVTIEGNTVFSPEALASLYAESIGKYIFLSRVYQIAEALTQKYHNEGYFLAVVTVPNQAIERGKVRLKVTEGYVAHVVYDGPWAKNLLVRAYLDRITSARPIRVDLLERTLLQLNDLPGVRFRAVMSHEPNDPEDAMTLTLVSSEKEGSGRIGVDNYSSRFLGPHQGSISYSTSLLPLQQTSVSMLTSIPANTQHAYMVEHVIPLWPDWSLQTTLQYSKAAPGYSLNLYEFRSRSESASLGATYQWLRSREQNLSLTGRVEMRDSETDALSTPFSRDRIRVLRMGGTYNFGDDAGGTNVAHGLISQGINGLGARPAGQPNLSREEAQPDFTKLSVDFSRVQRVGRAWSLLGTVTGQWASGPLYSSEEFGYGGQVFGRAYDDSDFVGDHGAAAGVELRYDAMDAPEGVTAQPYLFYDRGMVWNMDAAQDAKILASSVGVGVRAETIWGQSASASLAVPLLEDRTSPTYGAGGRAPRLLLQFSQGF